MSLFPRRALAALLACAAIAPAAAQTDAAASYPDRPIHLIVPYPPGASTDTFGRMIGDKISQTLGQPVIVENRGGASGNIGSEFVAKAAPDGYTILLGTDATHSANYHLFKDFPYDPIKDFAPITLAAKNILVLVANPKLAANNVQELIDYAKQNRGKLSFGSSGVGSPHHLAGALFNQKAGTDILHVPYRGGGPAVVDVMGGQVMLVYSSLISVEQQIKGGKVKALAITQSEPYPGLPGVPPLSDTIPGFSMESWLAFFAPAGVPKPIVDKLNAAIVKALQEPDVQEKLKTAGLVPVGNSPEAFATQLKKDFDARGELIRSAHIEAE